jgi:hypothetical protein
MSLHTYPHPPFRDGGWITDDYSPRHRARDIVHRTDMPDTVHAIESCTVTGIQTGKRPGDEEPNMVVVQDGVGAITIYTHVAASVRVGQEIAQGLAIGTCDVSGSSTGIHVHLVRLPAGDGTIDGVMTRLHQAQNFRINLEAW